MNKAPLLDTVKFEKAKQIFLMRLDNQSYPKIEKALSLKPSTAQKKFDVFLKKIIFVQVKLGRDEWKDVRKPWLSFEETIAEKKAKWLPLVSDMEKYYAEEKIKRAAKHKKALVSSFRKMDAIRLALNISDPEEMKEFLKTYLEEGLVPKWQDAAIKLIESQNKIDRKIAKEKVKRRYRKIYPPLNTLQLKRPLLKYRANDELSQSL